MRVCRYKWPEHVTMLLLLLHNLAPMLWAPIWRPFLLKKALWYFIFMVSSNHHTYLFGEKHKIYIDKATAMLSGGGGGLRLPGTNWIILLSLGCSSSSGRGGNHNTLTFSCCCGVGVSVATIIQPAKKILLYGIFSLLGVTHGSDVVVVVSPGFIFAQFMCGV